MIYSGSSVLLLLTLGLPKLTRFPLRYLFWGSLLFICYELCLSLSLGFSQSAKQAIEVGMVNYLWPSLTILLSVLVTRQKVSFLLIPGVLLAVAGIAVVLGGDAGFSYGEMINNVMKNPLSYGLAFSGAIIWAIYCVVTKIIAQGQNGVTLFFLLTALTLWVKYFTASQPPFVLSLQVMVSLLFVSIAMGFGYAAWNFGILHGNVTVLAAASYFIPIISALLAVFMLNTVLAPSFWQGTCMVSIGSFICWWSIRPTTLEKNLSSVTKQ